MSEPAKEKENIPDESAGGKRIPNGGNAAKTREVRDERDEQIPPFRAFLFFSFALKKHFSHMTAVNCWTPAPSAS